MIARIVMGLLLGVVLNVAAQTNTNQVQVILQPSKSPLIAMRFLFLTGAADDPSGKEGLAALTAALLSEGGSQQMRYEDILKQFYPMAAGFGAQVDKEMSAFSGTTHLDNLDRYYGLVREMILAPGFRESDFNRVKTDALNYLKVTLRETNDEELAKERLYNRIFQDHPYGHHNLGTISSLEKLTIDDVKAFYQAHYTRANLRVAVAGDCPGEFIARLKEDFGRLPQGSSEPKARPEAKTEPGMHIELIERDTRATAISIGFPIEVIRGHRDFVALKLAESYLGQHRSLNGHLFQRLREARGLNYGDYAYIEYFPSGMFRMQPEPNLARQQQIFQIWIRPVQPEQAHFALRAALYELDKLVREGIPEEAFEITRDFLGKYVDVLLQTQHASLGYALDSQFYRIEDYRTYMKEGLAQLTREDVNAAIKRHLKADRLFTVMVTKDAAGLKQALASNKPSPITYNSPKPPALLEEDKLIENFRLPIEEESIVVTPASELFR